MGIFDFITSGPIGSILKTVAPIVANAIPVVGPVINAALPALDGMLSHNENPPEKIQSMDVAKPMVTNFERTDNLIHNVLDSVDSLKTTQADAFKSISAQIELQIAELEKRTELRDAHEANQLLYDKITIAQKWLSNNQSDLAALSAASGENKFDQFLAVNNNSLPWIRNELYHDALLPLQNKLKGVPLIENVETYLLCLHWLLILNKVTFLISLNPLFRIVILILILGSRASNFYAHRQWKRYLDTLQELSTNIKNLRTAAFDGVVALQGLIDNMDSSERGRLKAISLNEQDATKPFLADDWPMLCVGDVDRVKFSQNLSKLAPLTDKYDANNSALQNATFYLYQAAARRALDAHLEPVRDVIANLTLNIPQWNSRLPPTPLPVEGEDRSHVNIVQNPDAPEEAKFRNSSWSFAVTYISSQGESSESDWSPSALIPAGQREVRVELRAVTFQYNPTAQLKALKDPNTHATLPSTRGVQRCVYMKVTEENKPEEYLQIKTFPDTFEPTAVDLGGKYEGLRLVFIHKTT